MSAAALYLPYIVSASTLGRTAAAAVGSRITLGCIGVGGQGIHNMRTFLNNPEVQVVAVCDVNAGSRGYFMDQLAGREPARQIVEDHYARQSRSGSFRGCKGYSDFRELLARPDIDAVVVCTPDHWHGLICVEAAKAGKDIYCEKSLTNTVSEGRAVCEAVKRYGRVLQTGSHERSGHNARFACELVRNGRIGKLHTIRVNLPTDEPHHQEVRQTGNLQSVMPAPGGLDWDFWLGPAPWAAYTQKRCHFWWRFILSYGGGEITDRGAHIIDLAQMANGTDHTGPVQISARGTAPGDGLFDAFMDYEFECIYSDGVRLIGQSTGPRGLRLEGTDGWVFIHIHGGHLEAEPVSLLAETIGPEQIRLGRSPGHHQNFIDAVRTRRQPVAPAETGHRSATICHLLNIAMLTQQSLKWDPQAERITSDEQANRMLARPMRTCWRL